MSSAVASVCFVAELRAALTQTTADHPQMITEGIIHLVGKDFYRLNDEIQIHMAAIKTVYKKHKKKYSLCTFSK